MYTDFSLIYYLLYFIYFICLCSRKYSRFHSNTEQIAHIFNHSFSTGVIPSIWKSAQDGGVPLLVIFQSLSAPKCCQYSRVSTHTQSEKKVVSIIKNPETNSNDFSSEPLPIWFTPMYGTTGISMLFPL